MLLNNRYESYHQGYRTMSQMNADRLDAVEKRLRLLPAFSVMDPHLTDEQALLLWKSSWDGQEHPFRPWPPTSQQLKKEILDQMRVDAVLIGPDEGSLLDRVLLTLGECAVSTAEEMLSAEYLARRLWLYVTLPPDGTVRLHMDPVIVSSLYTILGESDLDAARVSMEQFHAVLCMALYRFGAVFLTEALAFLNTCLGPTLTVQPEQCLRYLRFFYAYATLDNGETVLLHPGISDIRPIQRNPDRILRGVLSLSSDHLQSFSSVSDHLLRMLRGLVSHCVRPENSVDSIASDIAVLAAQGAGIKDMMAALSSALIVVPTQEMKDLLLQIRSCTPVWPCFMPEGGHSWQS